MISVKKIIALVLALVLLCAAAAADTWQAAEENLPRFRTLTELLKAAGGDKTAENRAFSSNFSGFPADDQSSFFLRK